MIEKYTQILNLYKSSIYQIFKTFLIKKKNLKISVLLLDLNQAISRKYLLVVVLFLTFLQSGKWHLPWLVCWVFLYLPSASIFWSFLFFQSGKWYLPWLVGWVVLYLPSASIFWSFLFFSTWQMVFTVIGRYGALILAFSVNFLVIYNLLGAHQIKLFFNPTHPITKFSRLWVCNQRELQGPKVACCYCFWVWGKKIPFQWSAKVGWFTVWKCIFSD